MDQGLTVLSEKHQQAQIVQRPRTAEFLQSREQSQQPTTRQQQQQQEQPGAGTMDQLVASLLEKSQHRPQTVDSFQMLLTNQQQEQKKQPGMDQLISLILNPVSNQVVQQKAQRQLGNQPSINERIMEELSRLDSQQLNRVASLLEGKVSGGAASSGVESSSKLQQ